MNTMNLSSFRPSVRSFFKPSPSLMSKLFEGELSLDLAMTVERVEVTHGSMLH